MTNQSFQINKFNTFPTVWFDYLQCKFSDTVHILQDLAELGYVLRVLPEMQISDHWGSKGYVTAWKGYVTAWSWGICCPSKRTTWIQQDMVNLRTSLHVKSLQVHPHKCIARVQSTAPLPFPCCGQTGIGPGFEVTLPEVEITNSLVFPTQPFRV